MKNKYLAGMLTTLVVAIVSTTSVLAFNGGLNDDRPGTRWGPGLDQESMQEHVQEMQALHDQMMSAVLSDDYETWAELMTNTPMGEKMLQLINKDNFDEFSEAHQLMDQAREKLNALGLGEEFGPRFGGMEGGKKMGRGMHKGLEGGRMRGLEAGQPAE